MISDEDFIKDPKVPGPTKEEIRCLVMCKSEVSKDDIVVEVGCGTGGLTLEFARLAEKVYAVDKNPKALKITNMNLEKHKMQDNVQLIQGSAPQVFNELPSFNILMVGGSSGELSPIIENGYKKLNPNGKIIVTAILLETRLEAILNMQKVGLKPDIIDVHISKGKIIKRGTMMEGRNPVAIISAKKI
ncbi:MAG: precorrin-6Y C5,15-methyltransferase (decarboxylating) subunit CbiT [Methanobacterium sp.]|nr:precorrin-6Y C5,15-methyltransferase (decarboxylating) subunit CbiT [Methanobacterium sp.]